jgi:hypothetical protein
MHKLIVPCVLAAGLGTSSPTWALTGHEWQKLTDLAQMAYVLAVLDTWDETKAVAETIEKGIELPDGRSSTLQALVGNYSDVASCVDSKKLTKGQIYNAVKRWADANPEERDYSMSAVVWLALREECHGRLPASTK